MNHYYLVAPSGKSFHGLEPLTFFFDEKLEVGQVVIISVRRRNQLGIVVGSAEKPNFKTTKINEVLSDVILTNSHLKLLSWMRGYYPGPLGPTASHFAPEFLNNIVIAKHNPPTKHVELSPLPKLTNDQKNVVDNISQHTNLLHGDTGSGKTRVYAELIKQKISEGKSCVVLTPEISLTTPMAEYLERVFGETLVICNHSNLTTKQRRELWSKLLQGNSPMIVVGPRSSLFLPVKNIGLIVVDESHDQAYKQESSPRYHALRVASQLSKIANSMLIFGSATPSVTEYFFAKNKSIPIHRMVKPAIALKNNPPLPTIVDMTLDDEKTNQQFLSRTLLSEIKNCLDSGVQALVFLNKRGSARAILCQNCGWKSTCPRCDLSLTYHHDSHLLRCHTCGYRASAPKSCPECNSIEIIFKTPGTKEIHRQLSQLYPQATIARFDKDNKKTERIEQNYGLLHGGEVDILVGTQILVKGHDLPNLGLVAMLDGDGSLSFPDYTAEEQTYQLILQLGGRVNRGHIPGKLLLQTYQPNNQLLKTAIRGGWDEFYTKQIAQRKQFRFPPFVHAMKLEVSRANRESSRTFLANVASQIHDRFVVLGPSPSFIEKTSGKYRWQLIVCARSRERLTELAKEYQNRLTVDLDPSNFL